MRAIILAAGRGSRLNGHVHDGPKALLHVGSASLIQRQIRALREVGIADVTVVVGCEADRVREHCGPGITYVENGEFATTNSLYSLWMARALLFQGCVVLNCDVLFHPQLLSDLLTARHDAALMLAYRRPDEPPYGDEEMKVRIRRGLVSAISKTLTVDDSDAENVGIARFSSTGALALTQQMNRIVATGQVRDWLPRAFAEFAATRPLHAVDSRGLPWIEIDFPDDYWRACSDVLPAIDADERQQGEATAASAGRTLRHV